MTLAMEKQPQRLRVRRLPVRRTDDDVAAARMVGQPHPHRPTVHIGDGDERQVVPPLYRVRVAVGPPDAVCELGHGGPIEAGIQEPAELLRAPRVSKPLGDVAAHVPIRRALTAGRRVLAMHPELPCHRVELAMARRVRVDRSQAVG